jgi:GNAT superfamily N-acetyltransferase
MMITTRAAKSEDEAWLFELHEDAHRELVEAAYGPWIREQQLEFFRPLFDDHEVYIIELAGTPVGSLYLGTRDGDTWLELIEVSSSRQNKGIGAAALGWVIVKSARVGRGVLLQVHRMNGAAKRMYEREGFIEVGQTETHDLLRHALPEHR